MNDAQLRLAFSGMHPGRVAKMVSTRGGASRALRAIERGGGDVPDLARVAVAVPAAERRAELAASGMAVVYLGGVGYPEHLARWEDAPDVLFVRGDLPLEPGVAVVGTRKCTAYGREVATRYGTAIADAGWTLVSGLARGIDGAAHRGTVDAGGVGVAVLGCGLDVAYPREHLRLGEGLVSLGGALVSEYPPGTRPDGWRFPLRNRVIAGLCRAVVVVEAAVTGGALITANLAMEYGISVFAVPGDVDRDTSVGCNLLIRDGAHPVLDPADLIEELALILGPPQSVGEGTTVAGVQSAPIKPG